MYEAMRVLMLADMRSATTVVENYTNLHHEEVSSSLCHYVWTPWRCTHLLACMNCNGDVCQKRASHREAVNYSKTKNKDALTIIPRSRYVQHRGSSELLLSNPFLEDFAHIRRHPNPRSRDSQSRLLLQELDLVSRLSERVGHREACKSCHRAIRIRIRQYDKVR